MIRLYPVTIVTLCMWLARVVVYTAAILDHHFCILLTACPYQLERPPPSHHTATHPRGEGRGVTPPPIRTLRVSPPDSLGLHRNTGTITVVIAILTVVIVTYNTVCYLDNGVYCHSYTVVYGSHGDQLHYFSV